MGNILSCIPKRERRFRKSTKKSRDEWEQLTPEIYAKIQKKPATEQNEAASIPKAKTHFDQEAKQIDKEDIEAKLHCYPIKEWDQNGLKLEDLGKIIHCSKVKICRQPCKDINNRWLILFQNLLLILSEDSHGFTYQGTLPLAGITVNGLDSTNNSSELHHAFQITGPLLHPFTVYCTKEEEVKEWLYCLNKQRQVSNKIADSPRAQICSERDHNSPRQHTKDVDLRKLILNRPIQGGERSHINSLGSIIWMSENKLQHLPFQDQHDRLLVLFPTTLLILSEEDHTLHHKGELPLNAITIFEQDEFDSDSNTLLIEGKMINQIIVLSQNRTAHKKLIHHLNAAGVTIQKAPHVNKGRDYKHSPQCRDQFADKISPSLEAHGHVNSPTTVYGVFTFPQKPVEMISMSEDLPTLVTTNVMDPITSPDYAEPYTPPPMRLSIPAEPSMLNSSAYKHNSSPLPIRTNSMRLSERNALALSQPPALTSENSLIAEHCLSTGYADPFPGWKMRPAGSGGRSSHQNMADSKGSSKKLQSRNFRMSGTNISGSSPVSLTPGSITIDCSPSDESLNNALSPTYAVPYIPFRLRPAPPAKPLWLREAVSRHKSSPLPDGRADQNAPLRKTLTLSQPPARSSSSFRKNLCPFQPSHHSDPLSPLYAEPFTAAKKQLAPSSASGPVRKQSGALARDQWSNTPLLALESVPRSSLPSCSMSGSSTCSFVDETPLADPLSPQYAEPYHSQPMSHADHFWMREEVSRRGSADFPVHCLKGKNISWYSDNSRMSLTSSEHTYAELESLQDDSDYEFWDFDFKQQEIPHLSAQTLMKLRQRGTVDSRLQGRLHRWS
ncbi:probable pleckstrin homology domain-containing family N member 1 isoform X2 [Stegostoma tigrinum]|uniref:probable pleckstrin homology domain-containing family N member 1 isoform X2 n=1 Tax=Stegostoma tigrinum TaxID=3053191 RepID=UPI002870264D|nr:probable pleckstrin homology domain-containing family N member 1 isoform X2 [Stegostoma tigrinum]